MVNRDLRFQEMLKPGFGPGGNKIKETIFRNWVVTKWLFVIPIGYLWKNSVL